MRGARSTTMGVVALALATSAAAQGRAGFGPGDSGRDVRLFSPVFSVNLPTHAGTGYHWEYGVTHSRNVQLIGRGQDAAAPPPPGVVGYPAAQRFTLRATGPVGEVRFGLFPPGPTRGAPQSVWRMTFHSAYAGSPPPPGRYY